MNKTIKHILITTAITTILGLCLSRRKTQLSENVKIVQEVQEENRKQKIQDSIDLNFQENRE